MLGLLELHHRNVDLRENHAVSVLFQVLAGMDDHVYFLHRSVIQEGAEQDVCHVLEVFLSGDEGCLPENFVEVPAGFNLNGQRVKDQDQSFGILKDHFLSLGGSAFEPFQVVEVQVCDFVEVLRENVTLDGGVVLCDNLNARLSRLSETLLPDPCGKQVQQGFSLFGGRQGVNHGHTLFPAVKVVLLDEFLIVLVGDVPQNVSDEVVCCLSEESLQSGSECVLVDAVRNDQSLGSSSTLQGRIDGAFVVTDEDILLDQLFLSDVPVEVARHHVVLDVLVVFVIRCCDA